MGFKIGWLTWEQRQFFENIEKTIDFRGRTPKKLGMDWSKNGYLALSALNVKNGYIDYSVKTHHASQELYDKWMSGNELKKGQVLFTTEAPMGNVAQVPDNNGYILSQRSIAFVSKKGKITDDFLAIILRTPKSHRKLLTLSSGGTAQGVSQKSLSHFKIEVPYSIKEQQLIGSLFKNLDHTITLHEEKQRQLEQLKKALLQKMFADKKHPKPELRFKGFSGDWEQRKLEKVFDTITDYVANGSFESLRKNVNSSDINGFAYLVRLQDASNNWQGPWLYTDQHGYEFLKKSRLQPDDIIMANVGSVGKFFLVPKLDKPMTLAPNAVLIKSSENDQRFLYQMMLTPEMQYKIFEKTTPGAQSKINKTDFKMIETRLPNMDEQKKIGAFFKQLDDTIALQQKQIDKLNSLKKSLLQNMFI